MSGDGAVGGGSGAVGAVPGRPPAANGELMLRTFAFPADANPAGDIFGGWLLGQMDIAGASLARRRAHGRVAKHFLFSLLSLCTLGAGMGCVAKKIVHCFL